MMQIFSPNLQGGSTKIIIYVFILPQVITLPEINNKKISRLLSSAFSVSMGLNKLEAGV